MATSRTHRRPALEVVEVHTVERIRLQVLARTFASLLAPDPPALRQSRCPGGGDGEAPEACSGASASDLPGVRVLVFDRMPRGVVGSSEDAAEKDGVQSTPAAQGGYAPVANCGGPEHPRP